jgi:antitoxin HicB
MEIKHPAIIDQQADGSFFVTFVDLPDTFTGGETKEEALFNAAEVMQYSLLRTITTGH